MHTAKINCAQSSKRGDVSAKVIVKASLDFSQTRNQIPLYQTSLSEFNLQILETRFCIRHRGVNIIFWQINSFLNNVHFLPHLFLNNCKYQTLQMEDLLAPQGFCCFVPGEFQAAQMIPTALGGRSELCRV